MPQIPTGGVSEESRTPMTLDEINGTVRAARDSVWVINEEMSRQFYRRESKNLLSANVGHLKLVMANPDISGSGLDLSDITAAIASGEAGIAELEAAPEITNN